MFLLGTSAALVPGVMRTPLIRWLGTLGGLCLALTACTGEIGPPEGDGTNSALCEQASSCFQLCLCADGAPQACKVACGEGAGGGAGAGGGETGGAPNAGGVGGAPSGGGTSAGGAGSAGGAPSGGGTSAGGASSGGAPSGGGGGAGVGGGSAGAGGGAGSCGDDGTGWSSSFQNFECEVLALVNQKRAQGASCGGVPYPPAGPLTRNALLTQSARGHAKDMGDKGYFSHQGLDGKSPFDRMKEAGYSGGTMGENIAAGQPSPASVVEGWMQSTGHCQNIMQGKYKDLGVGYYLGAQGYKHYWVQNFGG